MKKLKFINKHKFSQVMNDGSLWISHYRVYSHEYISDRLLIEYTHEYPCGKVYRTWYCPHVNDYNGVHKRKYKEFRRMLGGTYGLSGWIDKYRKVKYV